MPSYKGHNYGLCKKCGKNHYQGHDYGETCKLCGKHHTPPFQGHNFGICKKCGKKHVSRSGNFGHRGYHLSVETRLRMADSHLGLRPTPKARLRMSVARKLWWERHPEAKVELANRSRLYWFTQHLRRLTALYGRLVKELNPLSLPRVPDLEFARTLLEKKAKGSYYENTGLREHPFYPLRWKGDKPRMVEIQFPNEEDVIPPLTAK